jgi:hypothetical protein
VTGEVIVLERWAERVVKLALVAVLMLLLAAWLVHGVGI